MIASQSAGAAIVVVIFFVIAIAVYLLPTIIGSARKVVNIGSVFAVNLLLGWTLIGWAVALAMALRTNPPHAYPQFWQGPPQQQAGAPPAGAGPPPGWYQDPGDPSHQRWWDGAQWTDHRTPPTA